MSKIIENIMKFFRKLFSKKKVKPLELAPTQRIAKIKPSKLRKRMKNTFSKRKLKTLRKQKAGLCLHSTKRQKGRGQEIFMTSRWLPDETVSRAGIKYISYKPIYEPKT